MQDLIGGGFFPGYLSLNVFCVSLAGCRNCEDLASISNPRAWPRGQYRAPDSARCQLEEELAFSSLLFLFGVGSELCGPQIKHALGG